MHYYLLSLAPDTQLFEKSIRRKCEYLSSMDEKRGKNEKKKSYIWSVNRISIPTEDFQIIKIVFPSCKITFKQLEIFEISQLHGVLHGKVIKLWKCKIYKIYKKDNE